MLRANGIIYDKHPSTKVNQPSGDIANGRRARLNEKSGTRRSVEFEEHGEHTLHSNADPPTQPDESLDSDEELRGYSENNIESRTHHVQSRSLLHDGDIDRLQVRFLSSSFRSLALLTFDVAAGSQEEDRKAED